MAAAIIPWLILEVTTECNLRCKHCHMWMTKEPGNALFTSEKIRIIEEFASWKGVGHVLIAGGETLLKPDEFFLLARRCKELGLTCAGLTNATLMREEWVQPLLLSGLKEISISLDAPSADSYDHTRGVPGTFEKVTHWIRRLSTESKKLGGARVQVNTILKQGILPDLDTHIRFAKSLGADGIFFFPLGKTFWNFQEKDNFFESEKLLPNGTAREAFRLLKKWRQESSFISNSLEDIEIMEKALFSEPVEAICGAGEKNIIVDVTGEVRFCHLMETHISSGRTLGNVRSAPLATLCESDSATGWKKKMSICDQECKLLTCNRIAVGAQL